MIAILLLLVLAIHGGLFTGTILYMAYKSSQLDQVLSIAEKLWNPSSYL